MKIITILCLVLLSVHSYSQEVVKGPFLIRDGIYYHQDTDELVTGIVDTFWNNGQLQTRTKFKDGKEDGLMEWFHVNGRLWWRGNYKDGKQDGLWEFFDEYGNLTSTQTWENGEVVKTNLNP